MKINIKNLSKKLELSKLKKYHFEITDYITGEKRIESINDTDEKDAACFLTEVACDNLWLDELKLLKVTSIPIRELEQLIIRQAQREVMCN